MKMIFFHLSIFILKFQHQFPISKEEYEFGPFIAVSQFKSWASHFIQTS